MSRKPNAPDITVVIPAYNIGRYVAPTIQSVQAQTRPARIIVVNDGSTDNTAAVLAYFGKTIHVIHHTNRGVSHARNTGLKHVRTPFVFFLDGDDILAPDALERLHARITRPDAPVLVYGRWNPLRADGTPLPAPWFRNLQPRPEGHVLATQVVRNLVVTGTALMRTAAARRAGGFNPTLTYAEDKDFFCRMALQGAWAHVPAPAVLMYRLHAGTSQAKARTQAPFHTAHACIFNNADIRTALGERRHQALQRRAWAANMALHAAILAEGGHLWRGAPSLLSALVRAPTLTPMAVARFILSALHYLRNTRRCA